MASPNVGAQIARAWKAYENEMQKLKREQRELLADVSARLAKQQAQKVRYRISQQ